MDYNKVYKTNRNVWGENPNELLQKVWRRLKPGEFLDLGCGQGRDSLFMAKKGYKVTAVDASEEGIKSLDLLAKENNLADNIQSVCQGIKDFEIKQDKYWIINIVNTLHFLEKEDSLKIIKGIKGGLKRGGFVIIIDFTTQDPSFKKDKNKTKGFFQPQELPKLFSDFKIIFYQEVLVDDPGHPGYDQPHQHQVADLIAQKV